MHELSLANVGQVVSRGVGVRPILRRELNRKSCLGLDFFSLRLHHLGNFGWIEGSKSITNHLVIIGRGFADSGGGHHSTVK